MAFDFADQKLRELKLSELKGLEPQMREHYAEVERILSDPESWVDSPKGHIRVKLSLDLIFDLDLETGLRRIAFTTKIAPPKRIGHAQPIYRRQGKMLIADEPEQIPLAEVRKLHDGEREDDERDEHELPDEAGAEGDI